MNPNPGVYDVLVSNIGYVCSGVGHTAATAAFNEYRSQSVKGYGRAAGESVSMWHHDRHDPVREYVGTLEKLEAKRNLDYEQNN